MEKLLISYLADYLGEVIALEGLLSAERKQVGWLVNFYVLKAAMIRGKRHILAFAKSGVRYTPVAVAKQMSKGVDALGLPFVFIPMESAPHDIKRLIAANVSFVMPGVGMFLPDCGLSISRVSQPKVVRETFSVSAQLLVIGYILKKWNGEITLADAVNRTGFSRASIVHAFQEIEHFGAGERLRNEDGRSKAIKLKSAKDIWGECRAYFFNPCKRTVGVEERPESAVLAGVDALAQMSDLNEDMPTCFAMPLKEYRAMGEHGFSARTARYQLQLWHYPPTAIGGDSVDAVSLFLTLQNDKDDRVQIELDKLQDEFKW